MKDPNAIENESTALGFFIPLFLLQELPKIIVLPRGRSAAMNSHKKLKYKSPPFEFANRSCDTYLTGATESCLFQKKLKTPFLRKLELSMRQ